MPINKKQDSHGYYFQYGQSGHKYHFNTSIGEKRAWNKAKKQMVAIKLSQKSIK